MKTNRKPKVTHVNEKDTVEFDLYAARGYLNKQQNAQMRGIKFNLSLTSFKNLLRAKKCYYTGIELVRAVGLENEPNYLTIDRIDPNKGYEAGNVVACCKKINHLKGMFESQKIPMKMAMKIFEKAVKRGVE